MSFKAAFIRERKHLVIYSGRITNAQNIHTTVYEFFTDPVDSCITLGANQYLRFAV